VHPLRRAEERLHVVADLVGDDVGLREVPRGPEALAQVAEEREVEIEAVVARAVERPDRGAGHAARRLHRPREEHERRIPVLAVHAREDVAPDVLGVGEHDGDEVAQRVGARGAGRRLADRGRRPAGLEDDAGIDAEEQREQEQRDGAEPAPDRHRDAAAPAILDVLAAPAARPAHVTSRALQASGRRVAQVRRTTPAGRRR
jgi:hypothetical protein